MKRVLVVVLAVAMILSMAACGSEKPVNTGNAPADTSNTPADESFANNGKTYKWKCAVPNASASIATDYAALVAEKTDGRVTIETVDLAALGGAADVLEMCRNGTMDMIVNSAAQTAGEFPVSDIIQVPFFFSSNDEAASTMWAMYEKGYMEEYNNQTHCLFLTTTDGQVMAFANKKVESMADFAGMKLRVVSGTSVDMVDSFGASPVTMPTSDVYLSMSTKVINGAVSSPLIILSNSLSDVSSYVCDYPLYFGSMYCLINDDLWASLPADLQDILLECGQERMAAESEKAANRYEDNLKEIAAAGVEVYTPSEEFVAAMHEATDYLVDKYAETLSGLGYNGTEILQFAKDRIGK